jgi:hypothetical protein
MNKKKETVIPKEISELSALLKEYLNKDKPSQVKKISLENFSKFSAIIKKLIDERNLYLFFYDNYFRFEVKEKVFDNILHKKTPERKEFFVFLHHEFTHIIFSLLTNEEQKFIDQYSKKEEDKEIAKNKIDIVRRNILNDTIESRFLLASNSYNNLLDNLKWEINKKVFNNSFHKPEIFTAFLKFEFNDNASRDDEKGPTSFTIEFSKGDLDFLINELTLIKERLDEYN